MSLNYSAIVPYLPFFVPPLIGALIGYLTNRVAIRMLFRPLRRWYIGPFRIPMTPGVIPSKRHELAVNIGEMVGEHLLTSDEISNSLRKGRFQDHLYRLIEAKVGSFMKKDLGPVQSLVPQDYKSYFDIARKTVTYQVKETFSTYQGSSQFAAVLEQLVEDWTTQFFTKEICDVVSAETRNVFYDACGSQIQRALHKKATLEWIKEYVFQNVVKVTGSEKRINEFLPPSIVSAIIEMIADQTPHLLDQGSLLLQDPDVQTKLITEIMKAIEGFIETLGPMAALVQNFLDMETVEEQIRHYFFENQDEIHSMITSEEVQVKVSSVLTERAHQFFGTKIKELTSRFSEEDILNISNEISGMIASTMRSAQVATIINTLLKNHFEDQVAEGGKTIGQLLSMLLGERSVVDAKRWITEEIVTMVQSPSVKKTVDTAVEKMIDNLLQKPVGRLDSIIPAGVRDGLYKSLQDMATRMLISEVPGIVKSLNLKKIVTDRIDSFDLLRLEQLLLSIMEEQFKYINLFGGLLGFLIGCINSILIGAVG